MIFFKIGYVSHVHKTSLSGEKKYFYIYLTPERRKKKKDRKKYGAPF